MSKKDDNTIFYIFQVIHLKGAVAGAIKKPQFNVGNTPVELIIREHTIIDEKGYFSDIGAPSETPVVVTWEDVADMEGRNIGKYYNKMCIFPCLIIMNC